MVVTINTDASYHNEYKVGAFAFWIVSDMGRIMKCGALKNVKNCHEAELQCLCNAIHVLSKSKWENIKLITVNTDSLNAIHIINKQKALIKKYRLRQLVKYGTMFNKIRGDNFGKIKVNLKHVKAHTDVNDARSWVNDWCDRNAKEQLWKKINNK